MKLFLKIFLSLVLLSLISGGLYLFLSSSGNTGSELSIPLPELRLPDKSNKEQTVTFLAVGDIMLSRDVAVRSARNGKDGNYAFKNISELLNSADFNFGNLESPFSGTDAQDPDPFTFTFNAPMYSLAGLTANKFKVLNLANNHALNQGNDGILFTKKLLTDNGILALGAGANKNEAWQGQVYVNGFKNDPMKIGFIGATYGPESNLMAQTSELPQLKLAIADLKTNSDFVVVTMHAGEEYTREPTSAQTKFAKAAIDYGADIVIGAHPHWPQTFEKYKNKYIFYSLGNFVFDQGWSQDTREGLTLKVSLTKTEEQTTIKQIELIPIVIDNNSQPRVANETETRTVLEKIGATQRILK